MVFVYIKIYYAARERARRVINKPGFGKRISRRFGKNPSGIKFISYENLKSTEIMKNRFKNDNFFNGSTYSKTFFIKYEVDFRSKLKLK